MNEPNHFLETQYHPLNDPDRRWEISLQLDYTDCNDEAGAWATSGAQVFAATREQANEKMTRVLSVLTNRIGEVKATNEERSCQDAPKSKAREAAEAIFDKLQREGAFEQ